MTTISPASPSDSQAVIVALQSELAERRAEIEHLKLLVAKLKRLHFGRRSERFPDLDQLELGLEALAVLSQKPAPTTPAACAKPGRRKSARQPLPDQLPRETIIHPHGQSGCPDCGGVLKPLGEDVAEMLEYVPAYFKVIRHVRPKFACGKCDAIIQAPAPSRPIPRGIPGPGLLAHVLVGKFCDHLPLYRQSGIYLRAGINLDRATLADWVGQCSQLLHPLVEALRRYVLSAGKLHADDTPIPVLAPGEGKTRTGRLWTYVRDDRPAGDKAPPAVWFAYSPNRRGEHPQEHLKSFKGVLQADAYAGYDALYETGEIQEAACWAHVRRKFFDLHQAHDSPLAREALERIGALYGIEAEIRGKPPHERWGVRQERSRPLLEDFHAWLTAEGGKVSRKSVWAEAIHYALNHWLALVRYAGDGRIEMDNNAAERALRPVAMDRSLCTSSLSICKYWKLAFEFDATRAPLSGDSSGDAVEIQVGCPDLVRRTRYDLFSSQDAILDQATDHVVGHAELLCRFSHRQPQSVFLRRAVSMNSMHRAQRTNAVRGPGFTLSRTHSHSVQRRCDVFVGPSARHAAHDSEGLFRGTAAMLSVRISRHRDR